MQKGFRAAVVFTLAFLVVGMALLPASGQPGQWKSINPVYTPTLRDVWMISSTDGWAVGDSSGAAGSPGVAIHWDGTQWRQILTPNLGLIYSLDSVSCFSASNCIAVGSGTGPVPIMLQWDGISWIDRRSLIPAGVTALNAVHIRSDGLGFAVGGGTHNIVRVNVAVNPPTVTLDATVLDTLESVWILPPGTPGSIQGFAVGLTPSAWRWDGTPGGWSPTPPGGATPLRGVQVLDPNTAIAVGDSDSRTRWNGATWTPEGGAVIAAADWFGVYALASNDEWMVGSSVGGVASIAHWTGAAWTAFAPPNVPVGADLLSVYMLSSSDGWAVGSGGAIIRWNGSSWNSVASPTYYNLRGVWLASSTDGWAVGLASAPSLGQILRWNGANWNFYQTSPVSASLNAIHGSSSTNVLAVGDSPSASTPPSIISWTGGPAWTNISPAGVALGVNLYGVFAVSPSLAFAVGGPPDTLHPATMLRWDGTVWGSIPSGTANNQYLRSVWMVDSTGWAVGGTPGTPGTGAIVTWNGVTWAAETIPSMVPFLYDVQALSSTNVWAVGNNGMILHRDGTGWSIVPSGTTLDLASLYMLSANEGWAVGESDSTSPVILYWDGSTWTRVYPVPMVDHYLQSVWMVGSTDGWAVGQSGLILRFGPSVAATATTTTTVPVTTTSTTTQSVTATTTATTSTAFTQVTTTQTVTGTTTVTETSTTMTITPVPSPIPGFPVESILAGLVAGVAALFMLHRRRRT